MKKISFFFCSFLIVLLLGVLLFIPLVNFCGCGVTDQPWVLDLYPLKKCMAKNKPDGKIVIIGGSSSLFGISGKQLREYTGMDSINLSMSIMVPMRFYLTDLEKNVKKGDVVVLPLELTNQYWEPEDIVFSNFGISLLFGCNPETQKTLSFGELCSLYFQYGFSWVNTSLFHKDAPLRRFFMEQRELGVFDRTYRCDVMYAKWAGMQTPEKRGMAGYISDLSIYGDWPVERDGVSTDVPPYRLEGELSGEFLSCYDRIRKLTEARGATLLLVWPNLYFYAEQTGFEDFRKNLQKHGITIHGRPEAMSFPKEFYFEPPNHMNTRGAELWTRELAKIICNATGRPLKKRNVAWSFVVFADDPARYFPEVKSLQEYETGVRIVQKEFLLVLDVPENLRGKPLELHLIALPDRKKLPVFRRITVEGRACEIREKLHPERMEAVIALPDGCLPGERLTLSCSISGDAIGMERLFLRERLGVGIQSSQLKPGR